MAEVSRLYKRACTSAKALKEMHEAHYEPYDPDSSNDYVLPPMEDHPDSIGTIDLSQQTEANGNITLFYVVTQAVMEDLMRDIFYRNVIAPSKRHRSVLDEFERPLNYDNLLNIVYHAGELGDPSEDSVTALKGELGKINNDRNTRAHEPGHMTDYRSSSNPTSDLDRAYSAATDLSEIYLQGL